MRSSSSRLGTLRLKGTLQEYVTKYLHGFRGPPMSSKSQPALHWVCSGVWIPNQDFMLIWGYGQGFGSQLEPRADAWVFQECASPNDQCCKLPGLTNCAAAMKSVGKLTTSPVLYLYQYVGPSLKSRLLRLMYLARIVWIQSGHAH